MKKIFLVLFVACFALSLAGCKKWTGEKGKEDVSQQEKATVSLEEVGKALAPIICDKYNSCNENPEFDKEKCVTEISVGVVQNLKTTAREINQGALDICKKAIVDGPCEALNQEKPPVGCEFLE